MGEMKEGEGSGRGGQRGRCRVCKAFSGKKPLAHRGPAAGDALVLLCSLGAGPESPSGAGWESVDEHGLLLGQGEIANGCSRRTCKESPAWG